MGLLTWFAAAVRGQLGLLVIVAMRLMITVGGVGFVRFVAPSPRPIHPVGAAVPYAVAGFAALVLVAGVGLVVVDRGHGYLLRANEYSTDGRGHRCAEPAVTTAGLGLASGQYVIMVGRTTGDLRWRYARSGPGDRTTLARLSLSGRDVWTYALGACERARATERPLNGGG